MPSKKVVKTKGVIAKKSVSSVKKTTLKKTTKKEANSAIKKKTTKKTVEKTIPKIAKKKVVKNLLRKEVKPKKKIGLPGAGLGGEELIVEESKFYLPHSKSFSHYIDPEYYI